MREKKGARARDTRLLLSYFFSLSLGLLLIREHARAFSKVIEQQMGESGYYKFAALSASSSS